MTTELFDKIKANAATLDRCPAHTFSWPADAVYEDPTGKPSLRFGTQMTCVECGGTMSAVHAFIYAKGYAAAGGNINDVIPGMDVDSTTDTG